MPQLVATYIRVILEDRLIVPAGEEEVAGVELTRVPGRFPHLGLCAGSLYTRPAIHCLLGEGGEKEDKVTSFPI